MKKSRIFLFALMGCTMALAQTNTFPTSGDVGIGTTTPTAKLHVVGQDAHFFSNSSDNTLELGRDTNQKILLRAADTHLFFDWIQDADENLAHIMYFRNLAQGTSPDNDIRFQTSSADRLTIKTDGNVGIGTNSPGTKLDVNGTFRAQDVITVQTGGSYKVALNGLSDGYIAGRDNSFSQKFLINSNGDSWFNGGNVGIGTTAPGTFKLAVNGNVRAKEIKVETGWSDFVFEKDYNLPTLEEVEEHIQDKGHLKDIPSAEEVAENGILLGEMDSKLLQKIEELTLYMIDMNKQIQQLKKENAELRKER